MNKKAKKFDYVLAVIFVFLVIITIYPFLNVLAISFNDSTDTIKNVNFIIPRKFTLSNYKYVFKDGGIAMPAVISVTRTIIGTIVGIVCTSMVAYTLSRRDFVLRKPFQLLFVITMYVSGGMIPEYLLIIRTLKLGNNFMVYILPGLMWVYNMILVRSYIDGLPMALQEAAKLDGANDFQIWYKVVMPLCKPVIATVGLYYAVGQWNSFQDTLLLVTDDKLYTLQYVLYNYLNQASSLKSLVNNSSSAEAMAASLAHASTATSIRMTVTIVVVTPIILVYPIFQRFFTKGIMIGAVKG